MSESLSGYAVSMHFNSVIAELILLHLSGLLEPIDQSIVVVKDEKNRPVRTFRHCAAFGAVCKHFMAQWRRFQALYVMSYIKAVQRGKQIIDVCKLSWGKKDALNARNDLRGDDQDLLACHTAKTENAVQYTSRRCVYEALCASYYTPQEFQFNQKVLANVFGGPGQKICDSSSQQPADDQQSILPHQFRLRLENFEKVDVNRALENSILVRESSESGVPGAKCVDSIQAALACRNIFQTPEFGLPHELFQLNGKEKSLTQITYSSAMATNAPDAALEYLFGKNGYAARMRLIVYIIYRRLLANALTRSIKPCPPSLQDLGGFATCLRYIDVEFSATYGLRLSETIPCSAADTLVCRTLHLQPHEHVSFTVASAILSCRHFFSAETTCASEVERYYTDRPGAHFFFSWMQKCSGLFSGRGWTLVLPAQMCYLPRIGFHQDQYSPFFELWISHEHEDTICHHPTRSITHISRSEGTRDQPLTIDFQWSANSMTCFAVGLDDAEFCTPKSIHHPVARADFSHRYVQMIERESVKPRFRDVNWMFVPLRYRFAEFLRILDSMEANQAAALLALYTHAAD